MQLLTNQVCLPVCCTALRPTSFTTQVSLSSSISTTTVSSGSATVIKVTAQSDLDMIFDAINNGEDLAKLVGDLLTADVSQCCNHSLQGSLLCRPDVGCDSVVVLSCFVHCVHATSAGGRNLWGRRCNVWVLVLVKQFAHTSSQSRSGHWHSDICAGA